MSGMRAIAPADAAVIAALHGECFPDDPWSVAAASEVLAMPGAFGFLALGDAVRDDAGEPAAAPHGFIVALAVAGECEILALGVRPTARRRGIGRRLLGRLLAATAGISAAVLLEVAEDNEAALALYGRAGFYRVGRRPAYYRRAADAPAAALQLRCGAPPGRDL
jgi:[ribosomal protein S18]-alanine N-acetyltransferase